MEENIRQINDEYELVLTVLYYILKMNFAVSKIKTVLLGASTSDIGNTVSRYTLLQTMILLNKSKDFIEEAGENGICTYGLSDEGERVLTFLCLHIMKMKNNQIEDKRYCLDILEYLLEINVNPSKVDLIHISHLFFNNEDLIRGHPLLYQLEKLLKTTFFTYILRINSMNTEMK